MNSLAGLSYLSGLHTFQVNRPHIFINYNSFLGFLRRQPGYISMEGYCSGIHSKTVERNSAF